jgi:hypothetical protein
MGYNRHALCVETRDCSVVQFPATALILGQISRDPQLQGARLGRQLLQRNQAILGSFGVTGELVYDGLETRVRLTTDTTVGAIPLVSPTTGKTELGLVIHPRLEWLGVGEILGIMGWKIIPEILGLPLLPRSARNVPPWVISAIVLQRIEMLLNQLQRRFEFVDTDLPAPRGAVRWDIYATTRIPRMEFLSVPCRFSDLRDDSDLKAALHFALKQQLGSLQSQRVAGFFVLQLIELCTHLLERVNSVAARPPTPALMSSWFNMPVRSGVFRDALQAIEWTVEERGVAGLAELQGLPWRMSMDEFYEAWVETIASKLSQRVGGILKIGRKRETITPISWEKPYQGSQKSLIPDIVIYRESETIVIDAKYKRHWEDIQIAGWHSVTEEIQRRHRSDLMQVLAYSGLFNAPSVIACIAYPCRRPTWESLKRRNLRYHKASIHSGGRRVNLILIVLPMVADIEEAVDTLLSAFAT